MSYKIVVDSCCDLPVEYRKNPKFEVVPLILEIDGNVIVDDDTFDQADYLAKVAASENCAKTACPSPELYMNAYDCDADDVYVVTLSSKLSGSYNSALLGKDLFHEEKGDKNIHVFDSLSACCGETNIALKIMDLAEGGASFDEVVERVEKYRDELGTYFVLDSLETLRKNGRLTGMKALVATTLNIKPVCIGSKGEIVQKSQGIGIKKALVKMTDIVASEVNNPEDKHLMITHVNCYERACVVRDLILKKVPFKDAIIVDAAGVATTYAGDGGIVVTF
ncbi:DegV family protein [Butyrivibrio sp.]|uniref:DegV family protein n=1 Tax=Butyrivibrio sp. TaxID=28121 RepID=UPI0025C2827E|nr:DegV family protein [Butyrivibrio sp.]MBQ9306104.1 DegV family protein [Butyrivibrio sp.]